MPVRQVVFAQLASWGCFAGLSGATVCSECQGINGNDNSWLAIPSSSSPEEAGGSRPLYTKEEGVARFVEVARVPPLHVQCVYYECTKRESVMNAALSRSILSLGVASVVLPQPVFATSLLDGALSLSWRDAAGCFLLLLVLNTCSLVLIDAARALLASFISGNEAEKRVFPAGYGDSDPYAVYPAHVSADDGRIASWVTSPGSNRSPSHGGARVRIPIDADSFQSWQSIARDGVKKTR